MQSPTSHHQVCQAAGTLIRYDKIKSILDANGTNDDELPHGYDEWKPIVPDIDDSSSDDDDDDEPLARTLSYEDAQGVHANFFIARESEAA